MFRSISEDDFNRERTVRFAEEHFEQRRHGSNHTWIVRDVLPISYEAFCAVSLPWEATFDSESHHLFFGFREGYHFLKKPVPEPLTLSAWHSDFKFVEANREVPPALRELLNRSAASADLVFVRCSRSQDPRDCYHWAIERALFLELSDPFWEMPYRFGHFDIFPRGAAWYMAHRDDEPLLYIGGSADLINSISAVLPDQALPLQPDDRYF